MYNRLNPEKGLIIVDIKLLQYSAIEPLFKTEPFKICVNYVTFFKSFVTLAAFYDFIFIFLKFLSE